MQKIKQIKGVVYLRCVRVLQKVTLKISKLNTNYAIKLYKCSWRKLLPNVHLECFFDIKRAGKAFSCPWLFIHLLFNKRTAPLVENSSKRNYFIDGKHNMDNFNTTELHGFS